MPPASLYHRENISKVWLEVIDKTESFLRSVITTDGNPTPTTQSGTSSSDFSGFSIPRSDRHAALALLLEFSIQKGKILENSDASLNLKIIFFVDW